MKDLVVLAADKALELALKGVLARPKALGIRPLDVDIFVEPEHDPACARRGVGFLSHFAEQYRYGLLIFDYEGSGQEEVEPQVLQRKLNDEFQNSPWEERARVIVLYPELEAWIWTDSPHVEEVLGWKGRDQGLRPWLAEEGYWSADAMKPRRPKEAFEAALHAARKPRSSSLYKQIAERVSLRRCTDTAFLELRNVLLSWFPP